MWFCKGFSLFDNLWVFNMEAGNFYFEILTCHVILKSKGFCFFSLNLNKLRHTHFAFRHTLSVLIFKSKLLYKVWLCFIVINLFSYKMRFWSIFVLLSLFRFSFKGSFDDCRKNAALLVGYKVNDFKWCSWCSSVHAFNKVNPLSEGMCRYKTNEPQSEVGVYLSLHYSCFIFTAISSYMLNERRNRQAI